MLEIIRIKELISNGISRKKNVFGVLNVNVIISFIVWHSDFQSVGQPNQSEKNKKQTSGC